MNQTKLYHTQKRLTLLFTFFVFGLISVFGMIFFTGKYFNTLRNQRVDFLQSTQLFMNDFQKNPQLIKRIILQTSLQFERGKNRDKDIPPRLEIIQDLNFVIFDNQNNVVFENIRENMSQEIFENTFGITSIQQKKGLIIRTAQTIDYVFYFFKKQKYNGKNFLEEILFFLLFNLLFTLGVYFFGWYFIKKILFPVEQNISDMNDFIHNAGHELKTPLAITSSNLQLLSQLKTYDSELIENSLGEIKRMDELIVGLSQLSDIQAFSHQEKFSLLESIGQIISEYEPKILEKNITMSKELENISFFGNKTYFEILFSNLLSNAIKYNKKNGEINVSLTKKYLRIENTGNIITDEQKEQIFDRFYRIETARSSEGFGIGLSLVKKISDIFSWKIRVKNTQSTNIFEIEL